MLETLHIKNLALIREEEIHLEDGLNILTGETGAGKSVIIGSINLALGTRADADMIRTGEESALIELIWRLDAREEERVRSMDIEPEEDGTLIISRKISPGRSVCRVNGETVTAARLRELAEILINIHGQNDHQALLRPAKQKEILDHYCGEKLAKETAQMRKLYDERRAAMQALAETDIDAAARTREADLLAYEIEEISQAGLKEGEEEELEKEYRRMSNALKIGEAVHAAENALTGGGGGFADALSHARRELGQAAQDDEAVADAVRQIDDMEALLQDLNRSLRDIGEGLAYEDADYTRIGDRLDFIHRLQAKYGDSVDGIMAALDAKSERLAFLQNIEKKKQEAEDAVARLTEAMRAQCEKITALRQAGAAELSERIRSSLVDCNFLDVRFTIAVEPDADAMAADGCDHIRYDIQTNPGEAMRPLESIASGGELSRIMLGIKTVLADRNDTPTLIFDEIDAGISGKTAWRVSEKLGELAQAHQIICITHLPQIAAMADHHFAIEKGLEGERTLTKIRPLSDEESVGELARLLSADETTEEVLKNAAQLKERAEKDKSAKRGGTRKGKA